jgi:NAD(P)-dependent dehydrogenase (short-subunit alcohol dehydrogenase family)
VLTSADTSARAPQQLRKLPQGLLNVTADGLVGTVQVDAIAPVLLNNLLKTQLLAAPKPRVVHVGSANCYDPLGWPASNPVQAAVEWSTGKAPHPIPQNTYYWYSFSKFVLTQYAAELAVKEPRITSFTVNPGFFRDDPQKYANQCKPALLFTPCPQ